jgi:hypothetical protein
MTSYLDVDTGHYRRWALGILGDTPANRAATDQDLRRLLDQKAQARDKVIADAREALGVPAGETLLDRIDYLQLALVDAERDRDAFAEQLSALGHTCPEPVDGQPHAFALTRAEADALGLDLTAEHSATLVGRSYSVTGIFQIFDAAGVRVGGVKRSYPATRAEVSPKGPTFSGKQLRRRRARLERRLAHLTARSASTPEHAVFYDIAEASALQTALVLFDEALAAGGALPDLGAVARADRTEYLAHLITVLAELAAAGDVDAIRMHYERHKGVSHG